MTNARAGLLATRLLGVGLALALVACSDDASVTAVPTPAPPTPAPPTPTPAALVVQGQADLPAPANLKGGTTLVKWDFSTPAAGTVDVTIGYLNDSSQILVFVTDRPCNKWQFERDECSYLTTSVAGPRPRHLAAAGVRAGKYSLFVANDGPHDERIDYRVTLTANESDSGRLAIGPPEHFSLP